jgi:AraC-like DNA-binding protein
MLVDTISLELFRNTAQWKANGLIFLHEGFFMMRDFRFHQRDFLQPQQPYRLSEGRVVWVKSGTATYAINLIEYHFRAGDLIVFNSDSLIEKRGHSDDFTFDAFAFERRFGMNMPSLNPSVDAEGKRLSFARVHLTKHAQSIVGQYVSLLWKVVHEEPFNNENVQMLIHSLLLYHRQQHLGKEEFLTAKNRREELIHRFLALISLHAATERRIPFYADKLCVEPHYLSTLVKESTGQTVMQWINQTAIKEVKVWLAYSDESITEIAYRLAFPDSSALTKFFRRETGVTPSQYREQAKG